MGEFTPRALSALLLLLLFAFANSFFFFFGMRAEIRTLDYTGTDGKEKHEGSTLWMHNICPDWNSSFTGSTQPVPCECMPPNPCLKPWLTFWYMKLGVAVGWAGLVLPGGVALLFRCIAAKRATLCCCGCGPLADAPWAGERLAARCVFLGSALVLLDYCCVLLDSSRLDSLGECPGGAGPCWLLPAACAPLFAAFGLLADWVARRLGKAAPAAPAAVVQQPGDATQKAGANRRHA